MDAQMALKLGGTASFELLRRALCNGVAFDDVDLGRYVPVRIRRPLKLIGIDSFRWIVRAQEHLGCSRVGRCFQRREDRGNDCDDDRAFDDDPLVALQYFEIATKVEFHGEGRSQSSRAEPNRRSAW